MSVLVAIKETTDAEQRAELMKLEQESGNTPADMDRKIRKLQRLLRLAKRGPKGGRDKAVQIVSRAASSSKEVHSYPLLCTVDPVAE